MEFKRPVFVNLTGTTAYRELLNYLKKFGKVSNFDNKKLLSSSGCIVFGDVRKRYPPVSLDNGHFNFVFMMKQGNHTSASHEEFRILLKLKSPGPLAELDVGSFLAVFNPQPYSLAKLKSFSSGPDGVVVWYSKAPVPISKPEDTGKLLSASALTASPKSLGVGSIKKSFIPRHCSQPVATTSADRSGGSEERVNMPPPASWINMKKNDRVHGPPIAGSGLKASSITSRGCSSFNSSNHLEISHSHQPNCSHHSKCMQPSTHHCISNRTHHNCCSSHDYRGCCSVLSQPEVSCCTHRELSNSRVCGSGHGSCLQPVGSCSPLPSCSSKSFQCCVQCLCRCNCRNKTDRQCLNKQYKKTFSTSSEGSQWFIKTWVNHSKAIIGEENVRFPGGNHDIDSQQLTGRATYGGSMVDGAMSDDDNFTSISQILPIADPAQGLITLPKKQQSQFAPSSSGCDSDSSLSDTSTLFLKLDKSHPSTKPMPVVENTQYLHVTGSSIISSDMAESSATEKGFVADKLPSLCVPEENVALELSSQIELDGGGILNPDTEPNNESDTQKTCSQTVPSPQIDPSKRPGCRTPSDSEESPLKTRKKIKLFNPSNSSWIFNCASRDTHVPCSIQDVSDNNNEASDQIDGRSTEVADVVMETEKQERSCIDVELISQESVGVIPPSDAETESKNMGDEGADSLSANLCGNESLDKAICRGFSVDGLPTKTQVVDIIMDWSSDNNSSSSTVPVVKPADGTLKLTNENHLNIKDNIEAHHFIESRSPYECQASSSDKALHLQTSPHLIGEYNCNAGVPFTKTLYDEQLQNQPIVCTKALFNAQLSPDDSIYTNKTLLDAEMSQTLYDLPEQTTSVNNAECNQMSLTLGESNQDVNGETHAMNSKQDSLSTLSELGSSSQVDTLNIAGQISNNGNQISETESSLVEHGQIFIEIPVTVSGVENSPNIIKEGSKHPSPDSTTDGLSEDHRQEEYLRRNSPASTVFYDAESDNPSDNALEGRAGRKSDVAKGCEEDPKHPKTRIGSDQNIHERVSLPNQIFGVEGVIVDIAPHINEDTMTTIVKGVCRRGCKSMFDHDLILEFPTISRACTACASRTHYSCPKCHKSGFQKPLCFEFAFELHVLIGETVLRILVEREEGFKFLGITAKEYARKDNHALETLRRLENLCCTDPEEKTLRMSGQLHIKTEQRLEKIVPLLVNTRLKDFKMGRTPL